MIPLPPGVRLEVGRGGLERLVIDKRDARAELYLHGATLTAWCPRGQEPVLWTSQEALFRPDKAIRGGVPICFPWFGPRPGEAQHGWACVSPWRLESVKDEIVLALEREGWFVRYTIAIGQKLELALEVTNTAETPQTFEEALHAYFKVGDVEQVLVHGFNGKPRSISGEVDQLYQGTAPSHEIEDPVLKRRISILSDRSRSTVLWNPHIAKAKALVDFADHEWKEMLCIEPANAKEHAVTLAPKESHTLRVRVVVNSLGS